MKKGVLITVGVVAFFAMLAYMTMGQKQFRVEVCMEYQGKQDCRIASGSTKEGTQRTATENACALIASGMTDSMTCQRSTPVSVTWK